jgi:hypothetical protein
MLSKVRRRCPRPWQTWPWDVPDLLGWSGSWRSPYHSRYVPHVKGCAMSACARWRPSRSILDSPTGPVQACAMLLAKALRHQLRERTRPPGLGIRRPHPPSYLARLNRWKRQLPASPRPASCVAALPETFAPFGRGCRLGPSFARRHQTCGDTGPSVERALEGEGGEKGPGRLLVGAEGHQVGRPNRTQPDA